MFGRNQEAILLTMLQLSSCTKTCHIQVVCALGSQCMLVLLLFQVICLCEDLLGRLKKPLCVQSNMWSNLFAREKQILISVQHFYLIII